MATDNKPDGVRAPQTLRKTSNILALSLAAYREGDLETAFDLFIEGMESNLRDGELSSTSPDFAALIEEALTEARTRYDGDGDSTVQLSVMAAEETDDDDDLLTGSDLMEGYDEDDSTDDEADLDDSELASNLNSI